LPGARLCARAQAPYRKLLSQKGEPR
jgi:hypothetical protein